jgi:TatD DNase family protein
MIVNLHTHFKLPGNQKGLLNHPVQMVFHPEPDQYYSAGLHPWYLNESMNKEWLSDLEKLATHPQVLAIGECGLDRSIEISPEQQKTSFLKQVEIAEYFHKPLILHAVRTYSDLLQVKKARSGTVSWILHGYTGNPETTRQLIDQDFYFSFGAALLRNQEKLNQSLHEIPLNRLFFETDETIVPIESIYIFASSVIGLSLTELEEIISRNFRIFEKWETGRNEPL